MSEYDGFSAVCKCETGLLHITGNCKCSCHVFGQRQPQQEYFDITDHTARDAQRNTFIEQLKQSQFRGTQPSIQPATMLPHETVLWLVENRDKIQEMLEWWSRIKDL